MVQASPGGRHFGQQPRHLRSEAVRAYPGRGLVPLLRDERHERRATEPPISGHAPGNWGRIVFISSESALQIPVEMIHYGTTKTAQLAISRGLAESAAGTAVTVNSVLAGPTASEGVTEFVNRLAGSSNKTKAEFEKDFFRTMRPSSLLQRFARTEEVAAMVTFLCSPLASATNGAAVRADGGVVRSIL